MSAFNAVVLNDQNDGSGCQKVTCARSARFPISVLDLTQLFERAKFSPHEIDAAMKEESIAALEAVREDLA